MRVTNPIKIAGISYCAVISNLSLSSMKIIAAVGTDTLTSLDPWARAIRQVLIINGTLKILSTKLLKVLSYLYE